MKLTPLDLRKQQFKKAFRGYDPDEVHGFIEKLAQDWEEVLEEKRRAEERAVQGDDKLRHYEKVELALQEALEAARETGRRAEDAAHQRARLIIEEAELRAQRILQDAEQERYHVRQDLVKLTGRQNEIAARLRAFLMSEMEILAQFQGDDPIGFIKLVAAAEGTAQEALPGPRARLGPGVGEDGAAPEPLDAAPAAPEQPVLPFDTEDVPAPPAVVAPVDAEPEAVAEPPAEVPSETPPPVETPAEPAADEAKRPWEEEPSSSPEEERYAPRPPAETPFPEAPLAEAEPTPAPEPEPSPAEPSPAAFTYRDWLSGLARRKEQAAPQASPKDQAEAPVEEQSVEREVEREPQPFGRTFFRPPAPEPPPEPSPASDAARGWSLRSLVTGDREEAEPSSVVASDDERERIRRILEDLD